MYDERLTAPLTWWLFPALSGLSLGLILYLYGTVPGLLGLLVGAAAGSVALSAYGGVRIRVVQGLLVAGDARIPVRALGAAEPLDREEAFLWRTRKADARAFMLLRAFVPTALRVEVTDPEDPTPYLYLSTRNPEGLAAALTAARTERTAEQAAEQATGPATGPAAGTAAGPAAGTAAGTAD